MTEVAMLLGILVVLVGVGLIVRIVLRKAPPLTDEEINDARRRNAAFDRDGKRVSGVD